MIYYYNETVFENEKFVFRTEVDMESNYQSTTFYFEIKLFCHPLETRSLSKIEKVKNKLNAECV